MIGFPAGCARRSGKTGPCSVRSDTGFQIDTERHDVVLSADGCSVQGGASKAPDVTFTCDADTYILFAIGRLPFARSVRRGRLSFDGDDMLAARFPDWFAPE